MRWFSTFSFFLAAALQCAAARSEPVSREVEGFGATRDVAIANALQEAARQIFGLAIAVDEIRESITAEVIDDDSTDFAATDTTRSRAVFSTPSGVIQSYEILSAQFDRTQNQHAVRLRVEAVKFTGTTGGGSENRLRIAIIPARITQRQFADAQSAISAEAVVTQWNQALINEFVQSRKFAVLDREFVAEAMDELNIIASDAVPLAEQVRLGQQLGADFLLVGQLVDCSRKAERYTIQLTGESGIRESVQMNFSYRVIDVATREIRSANSFVRSWQNADLSALRGPDRNAPWLPLVLKSAGHSVANEILDIIYPIKVVRASSPRQITLNQGGIRMQIGRQFDVFQKGEVLIDPDTGESLGAEELFCGTIEVTRVMPKFSVAKWISGDFDCVTDGAICRAVAAAAQPATNAAPAQPAAPRFTFPGQN